MRQNLQISLWCKAEELTQESAFRCGGMSAGYSDLCERNKSAHCLLAKARGDAWTRTFTASSSPWAA